MMMLIRKIKHMRKNTGYLVTFSKSPYIAPFGEIRSFRRDKKGNKVTAILHTNFILFIMATWGSPLTLHMSWRDWMAGYRALANLNTSLLYPEITNSPT